MFQLLVITLTVLAWLTSMITIAGSALLQFRRGASHLVDVAGGFTAAVMWGAVALGASNVEVVSGGVVLTDTEPYLQWLAIIFSGGMLLLGVVGTTALVNVRNLDRSTG